MNYTEKILSKVREEKISKSQGRTLLIDYFYNSEDINTRIRCLWTLDTIIPIDQKSFEFLENLLVSDENPKIRIHAAKLLVKYFPNWCFDSFKWVIKKETSPLVLKEIFYLIEADPNPKISELKANIKEWFKVFGKKLGLEPNESRFILDLEALLASKENSSNILSEALYSFYKVLQEFSTPLNWFLIENNHLIELKFNYIKWKYLKNYSGRREILKKYKDMDMLLSLLLKRELEERCLIQIPPSISSLKHLKKLGLSHNNLNTLPASIKSLHSLKYLNLSHNNLGSIPESILSMKSLRYLDISYNNIENIPQKIQSLSNLEELRLEGNKFQSIPEFLQNSHLNVVI